jgi:ABC-type lipoprotein export system ATPase subunit
VTGPLVACHGITVQYGQGAAQVTALSQVDLTIDPGERLALLGRSGSGKTTLLHVIGGLVAPTAGEVRLMGEQLSSLDAAARGRARAAGIGFVFQGANLFTHLSVFQNIAFAARASRSDRTGPEPLELLTLVGLASKADSVPGELSGGESQRVAVARALAQRPELLLCDEPTGHLDSDTGERVLDLVDALQARLGFALVTATHDADVAARSTREVELENGRVVRAGALA